MKKNENQKDTRPGKDERPSERRDAIIREEAAELESLAALHSALRRGERPALSAEKSAEAAGLMGNQNVLKLMETGAASRQAIDDAGAGVDTIGLAAALSGQPDGPVCDMGTLMEL